MSEGSIQVGNKSLVSIKEAVSSVPYSRDYITRLAREKKIVAANINRRWYIDLDSLKKYREQADEERELRKEQLREERKRERVVDVDVKKQKTVRDHQAAKIHVRSLTASLLIAAAGLFAGTAAYNAAPHFLTAASPQRSQVSQVPAAVSEGVVVPASSATAEVPIADSWLQPAFVQEVRSMGGDIENGVLLLPELTASATPEQLFSDMVEVHELPEGGRVVVPVDAAGQPTGAPIPFVVVPVKVVQENVYDDE
jgi:hypothetical protein